MDDIIDLSDRQIASQPEPDVADMIDYIRSIEGGTLRDRMIRAALVRNLQGQEMMVE